MKWSSDKPTNGWWFQRWKKEPPYPGHWFIVEVTDGVIQGPGVLPGEVERAQLNGAEWAGPIELPSEL